MEDQVRGETRRDMLKKMGMGAAIAWTTPMVMSVSSAGAGPNAANRCRFAQMEAGGDVAMCGKCQSFLPCGDNCGCVPIANRDCCFCINNATCDQVVGCDDDTACAPGFRCVDTCCPPKLKAVLRSGREVYFLGVCGPPCGTMIGGDAAAIGGATLIPS